MSDEGKPKLRLEIAHVLFMDIVGYSRLLIDEQSEALQELNDAVRRTDAVRAAEASGGLILLPTGDGMALVFTSSVEAPVECALQISQTLRVSPGLPLRMGIHSGPVQHVEDVNKRNNIAGAGINIAQRVMDCGDAGHILVSRRVAEDLEAYRHWAPHLYSLGECEVKHGVRLHLVNLYIGELGNSQTPGKLSAAAARHESTEPVRKISDKSIAVLPFENLSADPENAFFVEGVHDEILTDLARIADLKVISRTSVMQYKTGAKRNLRDIAGELGVAHIVEGSVQRAGNRIRLRAQLIDARTDLHLWAEKFDRPLDDVFAIQSEIAQAVAEQLHAKLSPAEKSAIEEVPTSNLIAYDRYLRGKKALTQIIFDSREIEHLRQAVRLLDQAVAYDPKFYLAYCQLSRTHEYLYFMGADHTQNRLTQARQALDKALALSPEGGEAHLTAAAIAYHCERDYETALAELAIARRSLPNDSSIVEFTSFIARRQGQWELSVQNAERAGELDPRNDALLQTLSTTYWLLRRYCEMRRTLDRAIAISPRDATTRVARALIHLEERANTQPGHIEIQAVIDEDPSAVEAIADQWFYFALCRRNPGEISRALASISPEGIVPIAVRMPRNYCEGLAARAQNDTSAAQRAFATARDEMETLVREQPDYAEALSVLGMIEAALGCKKSALEHGRRAVDLYPVSKDAVTGAEILRNLAITYAWLGEKELAVNQLAEVVQIPGPISYGQFRLHPWWDPIRDDLRFEKLVNETTKPVNIF